MGARTSLYAWHAGRKAKIVDFAGWDMPVIYTSIGQEHAAARTAAGAFDISHMGRLRFAGPDAAKFLDHVLTNRVGNLAPNQSRYALVLNEAGGTKDDVIVTRRPDHHLLVVNASNRLKLLAWFAEHAAGFQCTLADETLDTAMIAVQGPKAVGIAETLLGVSFADLKYFHARDVAFGGAPALASRSGYTGEDGIELILPAALAEAAWTKILALGAEPVGLGARDTLRLEAGMPLYGHELTEELDPLQAGLGWAVKAADKDFVGKAALLARPAGRPVRVGLKVSDRRIPREGFAVTLAGQPIGHVASGTHSPTLGAPIAMAFVAPAAAAAGTALAIDIRGTPAPAAVVPLPFYKRGT